MALGARHPGIQVEGVEVSATNAKIARQLNRFKNVRFRQGLAEEVDRYFPPASFDLVYSFAVLEHVRDVDATLRAIEAVLRPGGRFAFVVPMHEIRARGPIPDYAPVHGYADHCRVFTETELGERFRAPPGVPPREAAGRVEARRAARLLRAGRVRRVLRPIGKPDPAQSRARSSQTREEHPSLQGAIERRPQII